MLDKSAVFHQSSSGVTQSNEEKDKIKNFNFLWRIQVIYVSAIFQFPMFLCHIVYVTKYTADLRIGCIPNS